MLPKLHDSLMALYNEQLVQDRIPQVARMARIGVAMWNVFVMVLMIVFFGN